MLHAAGLFHLRRFFRFPPPAPSRCYSMCRRGPCRNGRGRSFNTSHFKGGCCPLCIPHGGEVSPAGSVGVGKAPLALNASPAPPPTRRCHAGGVTEGVSFQKIPSPLPPPTHALFRRRGARWRGRGKLFYTSHFKGGDSRQWRPSIADRGGSRDPPLWNPRGMVAPGFFFVLLKDRTCLPLWGPQRASGTLPSGRSPLLRPSVLDGAHWAPGPEPAGETVPPKAAEGVCLEVL